MRALWSIGVLLLGVAEMSAQMHRVATPETVVRAVGVYEWTGDMAKPTASRLIPITLFINKNLEDAGEYLARPIPFALDPGTVYELENAGVPKGLIDLVYARHLRAETITQTDDDGWFGYGRFHALAPPPSNKQKLAPARVAGASGVIVDPSRPHFVDREGQPVVPNAKSTGDANRNEAKRGLDGEKDVDHPHLSRRSSSEQESSRSTSAGDPDRPTMKRRAGDETSSNASSPAKDTSAPSDDPDRPKLKRPASASTKRKESEAAVTAVGSFEDDPSRPRLHRGRPEHALSEADLPRLSGMPVDVQQMVAVSDAKDRLVHNFARPWEDSEERAATLKQMEAMAQSLLATYGRPPAEATPAPKPHRPNSKLRRPIVPLHVDVPLQAEQLRGFLLSYGDVPTFVYEARTDGEGSNLRYLTIVAQLDAQQQPKMVLHAVTDATHLGQRARMRLVDAVDIDASNRASLLFELRGETSRQFAVYRVLGLQAEQTFSTGAMQ